MVKRLTFWSVLTLVTLGCALFTLPLPASPTPVPTATAQPTETLPPSPSPTVEATQNTTPTWNPTPAAYGPSDFPPYVSPLSGKEVADPQLLERRPLAVKVQMFPRSQRPPWGISQAEIVFDYYQNFGLTRFHAIFYGREAEMVGPIRSARLLDIELVRMYKSIFAFGSAERRTYSRLFSQEFAPRLVVEGLATCPPLCRIDPNGNNYLVTNTRELSAFATSKGVDNIRQNLDGMRFESVTPSGGESAPQVYVRFSISAYVRWDYDPASGRYLRWQDTQEAPDLASEAYAPLIDGLSGQQIAAENVVVLIVPHQFVFNSRPGPNEVVGIDLNGSGVAYAFRDGQVFQVLWQRPQKDSVLFLTWPDGSLFPYKPGVTWYEVIGKSSQIKVESGVWRFQHFIP